jgi:hypothetical protein
MQRIEELLTTVCRARKRTGAVLASSYFEDVIDQSKQAGFVIVDGSAKHSGRLILTDDLLIERVRMLAEGAPCLFLNLELYVAPRLNNPGFLKQLVQKLVVLEPKHPIVFLLYSARVFSLFNAVYGQALPQPQHTLNLADNKSFI